MRSEVTEPLNVVLGRLQWPLSRAAVCVIRALWHIVLLTLAQADVIFTSVYSLKHI